MVDYALIIDSKSRATSGYVDISYHAETSQSNYFTGLGMLHGSDKTYGDFTLRGWAELSGRRVNYSVTATFNDNINPNYNYRGDTVLSGILSLGSPKDYSMHISWDLERRYAK